MKDRKKTNVTEGEYEILSVLWERGPSTVRDVHEVLGRKRAVGYTTVLKLMQIMHQKKIVRRDESERSHVYEACVDRSVTQNTLVDDLIERVFSGSAAQLVLRALSSRRTSATDLEEIRKAIGKAKGSRA